MWRLAVFQACVMLSRVLMVTPEMLVNLVLLELRERRCVAWSELHLSIRSALQEADCVVVSVFRVMLDVLEDLVPLAHLEMSDLR